MREPSPLATIHDAVLEFLRGRDDVVVFGATAVNAYVDEPRMTQDIGLMSTRAQDLAEELREYLSERFHIAVRTGSFAGTRAIGYFKCKRTAIVIWLTSVRLAPCQLHNQSKASLSWRRFNLLL